MRFDGTCCCSIPHIIQLLGRLLYFSQSFVQLWDAFVISHTTTTQFSPTQFDVFNFVGRSCGYVERERQMDFILSRSAGTISLLLSNNMEMMKHYNKIDFSLSRTRAAAVQKPCKMKIHYSVFYA